MLVGKLFKKFGLFLNTGVRFIPYQWRDLMKTGEVMGTQKLRHHKMYPP
jgi:hypothetical protein